jgi:hypothetical protein
MWFIKIKYFFLNDILHDRSIACLTGRTQKQLFLGKNGKVKRVKLEKQCFYSEV